MVPKTKRIAVRFRTLVEVTLSKQLPFSLPFHCQFQSCLYHICRLWAKIECLTVVPRWCASWILAKTFRWKRARARSCWRTGCWRLLRTWRPGWSGGSLWARRARRWVRRDWRWERGYSSCLDLWIIALALYINCNKFNKCKYKL